MYNMKATYVVFMFLIVGSTMQAQNFYGKQKDIDKIHYNIQQFSTYYINGKYEKLTQCYTSDGKIFPGGTDIIEGHADIKKRWEPPKGVKAVQHKITPVEIKVIKKYAYDYGYYEGSTLNADGSESSFRGKYVVVWRKEKGDWKIYLDIWNPMKK